jgi:hypothetical protein
MDSLWKSHHSDFSDNPFVYPIYFLFGTTNCGFRQCFSEEASPDYGRPPWVERIDTVQMGSACRDTSCFSELVILFND